MHVCDCVSKRDGVLSLVAGRLNICTCVYHIDVRIDKRKKFAMLLM